MRRYSKAIGTLVVAGLTAGVAGCAPADDGRQTLNVMLNGNEAGIALETLTEQFQDAHPDMDVNVQVISEQQMRDKLLLDLQAKSSTVDVYMTLPSREGAQFESSGYYEPLQPFVDEGDGAALEGFSDAMLRGMHIGGQLVALPMNIDGPILFYRTDLLAEAGVEVPTTLDELMDAAEKLSKATDGSWVPITLRGQPDSIPFTFGPFIHGNGLEWTTDGVPNFTDPRAINAIDQYATLARDFGPEGVINYSFNESTNLFAAGGAAMILESSDSLPTAVNPETSKVADVTGVANFPGGVPSVLSWAIAMSPYSKAKDAAWEYMTWATSEDVQLQTALLGVAPPRGAIYEAPEFQAKMNTPLMQQWVQALGYLVSNGHTEISVVAVRGPEIRKVIGDGIDSVILGVATPEEAAQSIQEQVLPLLDE